MILNLDGVYKRKNFTSFPFTMPWSMAFILSLLFHLLVIIVYFAHFSTSERYTPPSEVRIKIGSSGVLQVPETITPPAPKKTHAAQATPPAHSPAHGKHTTTEDANIAKKPTPPPTPIAANGRKLEKPTLPQKPTTSTQTTKPKLAKAETTPVNKPEKDSVQTQAEQTPSTKGYEKGNKVLASQTEIRDYEDEISTHINQFKFLPKVTRRKLRKLDVYEPLETTLEIQIDRDGYVMTVDVVESSGYGFIDNLSQTIVQNSSPVPPWPEGSRLSKSLLYIFKLTIEFPAEVWQPSLR